MTTNYEKHFGDPLRVAETLSSAGICWGTLTGEIDCGDPCDPCPLWDAGEDRPWKSRCKGDDAEKWQEWLEKEAEGKERDEK